MKRIRGRPPLRPQNTRLDRTDVGRQHLFYARVHQDNVRSSLLASDIRGVVYSFLQNGIPCTCRIHAPLLDDDGHLTEDGMKKVLSGSAESGSPFAGPTAKPVFGASDVGLDGLEDAYESDSAFDENDLEPPDLGDDWGAGDFASGGSDVVMGGLNQDRCTLCYGSGFVGGFRTVGGSRIVLSSVARTGPGTTCSIDKSAAPHRFHDGDRVVFPDVKMPHRAGQRVHIIRAWDGDKALPRRSYGINRDAISAALSDGDPLDAVEISSAGGDLGFTHIEIQALHRDVHIDFVQVPDDFQPNRAGRSATATITLPPDAPASKYSIVRDSKYGRAWQVSRVSPHLNNRGTAVWFETEARLVGQHEIYHTLAGVG